MTNAAIYLRISRDDTGDGLAVDRQREDCIRIVTARGWQFAGEYVDNSISATDKTKTRPAYDRLLRDFSAGRFDALVCWDLDRLTRQPRQLEDWIDAAEDRGLKLVTANGEADLSTDGGRTYARIKAAVARGEVERKSARQTRANRQAAEAGKGAWNTRPFGYLKGGEIHPEEGPALRDGYERILAGQTLADVARAWNAAGLRGTRGRPWDGSTVAARLRRPVSAGIRTYRGREYPGDWEALVSEDTYRAVLAILSAPERTFTGTREPRTLLAGMASCACGGTLYTVGARGVRRYQCHGHVEAGTRAGHFSVNAEPVDSAVVELTGQLLTLPGILEAVHSDDSGTDTAALRAERRALVIRRDEEIPAMLADGLSREQIAAANRRINSRLEEIDATLNATAPETFLAVIQAAPTAPQAVAAWREQVWNPMPLEAQRATVRALWVVTVARAGVEIETTDLAERMASSVGALGLVRPEFRTLGGIGRKCAILKR